MYNLNAAPHPLRQSWFMNHYWAISPLHPNNSSTMLHSSVCPPLHQSYLSLTYNCVILVHVMSPSHCSGFHGAVHRSVPLLTITDCFAACIAFPAACSVSLACVQHSINMYCGPSSPLRRSAASMCSLHGCSVACMGAQLGVPSPVLPLHHVSPCALKPLSWCAPLHLHCSNTLL